MMNMQPLVRKVAVTSAGLAVAGMALVVGCSAKESPAPTAPAGNNVESKRPQTNPDPGQTKAPNSFGPAVTAPPPATAVPGDN